MNKSNCCEKCKTLAGMAHLVFQCGNPSCECHQKATTHEIEGWEKELFDMIYSPDNAPAEVFIEVKVLIDELLTHQQERIIAALEGMKKEENVVRVSPVHLLGFDVSQPYNQALTDAIEVVKVDKGPGMV